MHHAGYSPHYWLQYSRTARLPRDTAGLTIYHYSDSGVYVLSSRARLFFTHLPVLEIIHTGVSPRLQYGTTRAEWGQPKTIKLYCHIATNYINHLPLQSRNPAVTFEVSLTGYEAITLYMAIRAPIYIAIVIWFRKYTSCVVLLCGLSRMIKFQFRIHNQFVASYLGRNTENSCHMKTIHPHLRIAMYVSYSYS